MEGGLGALFLGVTTASLLPHVLVAAWHSLRRTKSVCEE